MKSNFTNAVHLYTEGIQVGCQDNELDAKLYSNRATVHFYLGKSIVLFTFLFEFFSTSVFSFIPRFTGFSFENMKLCVILFFHPCVHIVYALRFVAATCPRNTSMPCMSPQYEQDRILSLLHVAATCPCVMCPRVRGPLGHCAPHMTSKHCRK